VSVAANGEISITNVVTVTGGGDVDPIDNTFTLVSVVNVPKLSVSKTPTPSAFSKGQNGVYTILVSNGGSAPSSGPIRVTDTLDPNLTFVSATGSGWSCGAAAQVVTCTTPAVIAAGASAPSITLTVNVAANAPVSVTNNVAVAGGASANNSSQLVTAVDATDLRISKTANPATFTQGQNAVYTITASNIGNAPTSGMITVTDTLDPNLTFVSATGSNWSCSAAAQVVTCTTSAAIAAQGSAPAINITVNVAANGRISVTNLVTISGGGDVDPADNTFTLVSNVNAANLSVSKTANPATFTQGQNGGYAILVSNGGTAPSSGTITVTDTLDPNLTFVSATGSGWSCSAAAQVVTCTMSAVIPAQGSAPAINITVNVAASAPSSVTNAVTVTGGGGANTNNSFQLVSTVNAPKLSVSKTATPSAFSKGQNGVYAILVSNGGTAPSSGTITVTDTLDSNLTFVSANGSGWSCSTAARVVTCTTPAVIPAGVSAPSITITVNVATNAPVSVTNNVTVAGGGSANNSSQLVTAVDATDLRISKTANPATFIQGQNAVYTITASNIGNAPTSGMITVTDTLDPSLTFVSATGSGWSCSDAAQIVTCTTSAAIPVSGSAPPLSITVKIAMNAPASVANNVTVAGGGESNTSNSSFQLVSNVNGPSAAQSVPAMTTPMLILTGMVLIGLVVWLRRRAAYPGQL
jgi:uncharacterized repeat protein (TIGR01451 family)